MKPQCQAIVDIPRSDGSAWRKGLQCPEDATVERCPSTQNRNKVKLCWVHAQALDSARNMPLRFINC